MKRGLLVFASLAALLWLERRRPLRRRVEPGLARLARNAVIGATAAATVAAIESPVTQRVGALVERHRLGLLPRLRLSPRAERVAALLLLDYTLFLWHILLHRVPVLWRAHRVHHADLDLDASTGLRFQALEMLASVPWRAAQMAAIGVSRATLSLWATLTLVEVLFHHSNWRLPLGFERCFSRLVATPRLHGIHHSTGADERMSNFSSGLAIWDRLHGTWRDDVPQAAITIGLPGLRRADQVRLPWALAAPLAPGPSEPLPRTRGRAARSRACDARG